MTEDQIANAGLFLSAQALLTVGLDDVKDFARLAEVDLSMSEAAQILEAVHIGAREFTKALAEREKERD